MTKPDPSSKFLDPATPKQVRMAAARGFAPLGAKEMVELLTRLMRDADAEIAAAAAVTLADWPEDELLPEIQSESCSPEVLDQLASSTTAEPLLEAIIINTATPSATAARLARTVPGRLLELILYNKVRILECPAILTNAKVNPAITAECQRLVQEIESEFFSNKSTAYSVGTGVEEAKEEVETEPSEILSDLTSLEGLPVDPGARESAIFEKLSKMTVPQKMRTAMFGTREVRAILIRDPNREVARNVLRSPKLTDNEIETFASMRNVSDDVLRDIGNSRELTRTYGVVHGLVKNPRTPAMISQRLLGRLQTRHLTGLTRDRGIPEAVRRNAQRILNQRLDSK
jgi:hypothetical protein